MERATEEAKACDDDERAAASHPARTEGGGASSSLLWACALEDGERGDDAISAALSKTPIWRYYLTAACGEHGDLDAPRTPPTPFPAGEYHDDDDELVDSFLDGLDEADCHGGGDAPRCGPGLLGWDCETPAMDDADF